MLIINGLNFISIILSENVRTTLVRKKINQAKIYCAKKERGKGDINVENKIKTMVCALFVITAQFHYFASSYIH